MMNASEFAAAWLLYEKDQLNKLTKEAKDGR